jgi:hypothetical protein
MIMKAFFLLLLLLPTLSFAQVLGLGKRLNQYQASNGKTYRVGDTIKLAQGSSPNGTFRYVQYGGWMMFLQSGTSEDKNNLERDKSGYGAVIRKMHSFKAHGVDKVVFAVDLGIKSNCDMWIEDAIATCEIVDCNGAKAQTTIVQKADDKFDQLKKLKDLFDGGAITKTEYDEQKKKLLNQ